MTAPSPSAAAVRATVDAPTQWGGTKPLAAVADPEHLSLTAWLLAKLGRAA